MSEGPRIGQDEWVARSGENIRRNRLEQALDRVPGWARLLLFAVVVASIPLLTDDGYVNAVVFDTLIFCLLAIGLNVAVGWGGLLDLGYIAFFGFGAYTYAILSSEKFDLHVSSPGQRRRRVRAEHAGQGLYLQDTVASPCTTKACR